MSAKCLYDQLDQGSLDAMALLLGFDKGAGEIGFKHHLEDIPPLMDGFNVSDAIAAYALHLIRTTASAGRAVH